MPEVPMMAVALFPAVHSTLARRPCLAFLSTNAVFIATNLSMYAGGGNDGHGTATAAALPIVALPIIWESFSVRREGADALLQWSVLNERNSYAFSIERSYHAMAFTQVGNVLSAGTANQRNTYRFIDKNPANGCLSSGGCRQVFYRIRQISIDLSYSLSVTRSLLLDVTPHTANAWPNPASDKIVVRMPGGLDYDIYLFNNMGSVVLRQQALRSPVYEIDIRELPSGLYYLKIITETQSYPYQITITH
jgi:hypothetical protein